LQDTFFKLRDPTVSYHRQLSEKAMPL